MSLVGKTVGKYRIDRAIGVGGMGAVYAAVDTYLDRPVAFKVLAEPEGSEEWHERFIREARVVARLDHRNVIRIHDAGNDLGFPFIAMEYVEGEDGRRFLESGPSLEKRLDVFAQICEGLAVAHEHGVVHRDVKPGNFIVLRSGVVKLIDFGLARVVGDSRDLTKGQVFGSASYMAPEQILTPSAVDYRADLFAAGSLLFEFLAGRPPFRGTSAAETIWNLVNREPEPLERLVPGLPDALCRLVAQALQKDPGRRPPSAAAMGAVARQVMGELIDAGSGRPSLPPPLTAPPAPTRVEPELGPADEAPRPLEEDTERMIENGPSPGAGRGEEPTALTRGSRQPDATGGGGLSRWHWLAIAGIGIGLALIVTTALLVGLRRFTPPPSPTPSALRPAGSPRATPPAAPASPVEATSGPGAPTAETTQRPRFESVHPGSTEVTLSPGEELVFSVVTSGPSGLRLPRWVRNDVPCGEGPSYRFRAVASGTRELLVVTWGEGRDSVTRIWYVNTTRSPLPATTGPSAAGLGR